MTKKKKARVFSLPVAVQHGHACAIRQEKGVKGLQRGMEETELIMFT